MRDVEGRGRENAPPAPEKPHLSGTPVALLPISSGASGGPELSLEGGAIGRGGTLSPG